MYCTTRIAFLDNLGKSAIFLASKIASASISAARRAAVVSVEKKGLPVPQAKITILPLSGEKALFLKYKARQL